MYTIDKAIECAKREAHIKQTQGKLFVAGDESPEAQDFTDGDPETLYSIASMYAQYIEDMDYDTALSKIEDALILEFPDFI